MRHLAGVALCALATTGPAAADISDGVVKLGILNDMSSVYADVGGIGAVHAARLAVEDAVPIAGARVEIVFADHLNKPDASASPARGSG